MKVGRKKFSRQDPGDERSWPPPDVPDEVT